MLFACVRTLFWFVLHVALQLLQSFVPMKNLFRRIIAAVATMIVVVRYCYCLLETCCLDFLLPSRKASRFSSLTRFLCLALFFRRVSSIFL